MADIFLSYARADAESATLVANAFRADRYSVFFDTNLVPGDSWDRRIEIELAAAKAVVVLWSAESVKRQWVRNEARDGMERGILCPAIIDTCKIPVEFTHLQAADLRDLSVSESHTGWQTLTRSVRSKVETGAPVRANAVRDAIGDALNERGAPLSSADIIKSDLLQNSGLSNAEADAASRKWEQTEDLFERENFARLLYMMPFLLTGERLASPNDVVFFRNAVDRAGGVRTFIFEQLPRHAHALHSIFSGSIDVGPVSAEVNRRVALMKEMEQWDWAPCVIAFLVEHAAEHGRARHFFQALDRFAWACELSVVDSTDREGRYATIVKHVGDDKLLYAGEGEQRALALTGAEQMKFLHTLNRSRKRDPKRRLLLMRLEAAMPGGRIVRVTDDATVERVLPRNGGPWWNERFPDPELRSELANLLGNLTLLTHNQNKDADDHSYPVKRVVYFDTDAPIYALTKDIAPIEEWTLQAMEERHERLVRILVEEWGLLRE